MEGRRLPTTEDVVKRIKDDGDFDSLRLKIIRVVKENEELRKNIIEEVKQSNVLNQDGSEDMKPRQLSDAIYEELGRKITGQISDEIWKTIRLNESIKGDIKTTVERVCSKMGIEPRTNEASSPSVPYQNQIVGNQTVGREANGGGTTKTSIEASILNSNETNEPPGCLASGGDDNIDHSKNSDLQENEEERPALIQDSQELLNQNKAKELVPGLPLSYDGGGGGGGGVGGGGGEADDDSDLPPGFN